MEQYSGSCKRAVVKLCLTCDSFISSWASRLPYHSHKGCVHISHIKGLLGIGAWGRAGAGQGGTVVSCCPPKAKAGLKVWSPLCVVVCKTIFSPPRSNGPHNVLVTVWSDGSVQYSIYTWIQIHMHNYSVGMQLVLGHDAEGCTI